MPEWYYQNIYKSKYGDRRISHHKFVIMSTSVAADDNRCVTERYDTPSYR